MAKESKVAEYSRNIALIYKGKTAEQLKEEQKISILAHVPGLINQAKDWAALEADIIKRDEAHKKEVEKAFEALRGRLSVEACLEDCAALVQGIKDISKGKPCDVYPVVELEFLESENVTAEDVEKAAEFEREAQALVSGIKEKIENVGESIREAEARTGGSEALSKKLKKLEAQRKKALLAGDDLAKLNAEIMALRDEIEANKMAVGIAEQDAETLKEHREALAEVLTIAEELAAHVTAKAAALFAHSKVAELNQTTARLVQLAQEVADAKRKTSRVVGCTRRIMCNGPTCGESEILLSMWRGRRIVPDFEGGVLPDNSGVKVKVYF